MPLRYFSKAENELAGAMEQELNNYISFSCWECLDNMLQNVLRYEMNTTGETIDP